MQRLLLVLLTFPVVLSQDGRAEPYTPRLGSPERVAICNAMRPHVLEHWSQGKPTGKILFKINHLKVKGDFAFFEGRPTYADGSDSIWDCMLPVDYALLLQKHSGSWRVIGDFCGTDVPPPEYWRKRRAKLSPDFPADILTDYYRKRLGY